MNQPKHKIILVTCFGVIFLLAAAYLAVFGRALGQKANHVGILLALPRVMMSAEAVRVDDQTYLAKDTAAFVREMERQGFSLVEQLGAGYFLTKNGESYSSDGRMYSSHFMIFTHPLEN